MEENLAESELEAYSYPHMQRKLKEHFGDKIIQIESRMLSYSEIKPRRVLHDFYSHQDLDPEKDKKRIIETAAKLIRDDIKAVNTSHCDYPGFDELESENCINYLPTSLKTLLTGLIVGKGMQPKVASIGQAIMQAAQPRVYWHHYRLVWVCNCTTSMHHAFWLTHYITLVSPALTVKSINLSRMQPISKELTCLTVYPVCC